MEMADGDTSVYDFSEDEIDDAVSVGGHSTRSSISRLSLSGELFAADVLGRELPANMNAEGRRRAQIKPPPDGDPRNRTAQGAYHSSGRSKKRELPR